MCVALDLLVLELHLVVSSQCGWVVGPEPRSSGRTVSKILSGLSSPLCSLAWNSPIRLG